LDEERRRHCRLQGRRHPLSRCGANLARNPGTGQPTVAQTTQDDNSDSKESKNEFENGFVDAPGGSGKASDVEADAKQECQPEPKD